MNYDYEPEYTPDEPQTDAIWLTDANGNLVEQEVTDDAEND